MHSRRTLLTTLSSFLLAVCTGCSKAPNHPVASGAVLDPSIQISVVPLERMDDSQLRDLVEASATWRKSRGPSRTVVDQVVLVDDVRSFFSVLATWNQAAYFPILINDPSWTPAFIRAFRPARIVRFQSPARARRLEPLEEWRMAENAVSRTWMKGESGPDSPPPAGSPPRELGATPPGVVLSHPGSASLAGAAALAAGRFQPLLRIERIEGDGVEGRRKILKFDDVPNVAQALDFARSVESRVASIASEYGRLGDRVDFLTLAGDWPYRYRAAGGPLTATDERALDDLVGRVLSSTTDDVDSLRLRWAYAGRLLGNPAASVYRAMASLFLQPRSALLWNTYSGGSPWSEYDVAGAASILRLVRPGLDVVRARSGIAANLSSWLEATSVASGRDLLLLNSSGAPDEFSITGGPGLSADVPFGPPSVVSMIHSFSAAAPTDPATIAGRFLERGAFAYYGSMNEPYLTAFRAPYLVAQMIAVETPLAAALRQGPYEAFGKPWRLVYLGDPLYHVEALSTDSSTGRTPPGDEFEGAGTITPRDRPDSGDPEAVLDWCDDALLLSLTSAVGEAIKGESQARDLLNVLSRLDREVLSPAGLARFDALLVDQSSVIGDYEGLTRRLLQIPARSRSPMVWRNIETSVLVRLAELLRKGGWPGAVELWEPIAIGPWPSGADFPARLTRRLALAVEAAGPQQVEAFHRRLSESCGRVNETPEFESRRSMLVEELKRLEKTNSTR